MIREMVKEFKELNTIELYEILRIRSEVFVLEQECIYLDMDQKDQEALHVYLEDKGEILAYLRVLPPGLQCEEMAIGRVLTTKRKKGFGKRLVELGIKEAYRHFGVGPIRIEAQSYTEKFYGSFGFKRVSEEFLEDGIPHIEMYLEAPEVWDVYDRNLNPIGKRMFRGDAFHEGEFHLVSEVLLEHEDGTFLVMTRDPHKPIRPGEREATAGGSAESGEDPLTCAKRELLEETGIRAQEPRLIKKEVGEHTHYFYFHAKTDVEKDSVITQEGETCDYQWLTKEELLALIKQEHFSSRQGSHLLYYLTMN